MLEQLRIRDFQPHATLTVDLDRHVTTIAGPSDVGKSSVMRALRWVCQNKPQGDGVRRDGTDNTKAGLRFDGHKLTRSKGKAGNTYTLDGQEFKAIGTGVPEPIADLLRLDDINFQGQHDAAFWFSLSPGQVSKELNRVVNLDAIDRVMGELLSRKRKASMAEQIAEDRLKKSKETVERLSFAEQVAEDMRGVQDLEDVSARSRKHATTLRQLGDNAALAARKAKTLRGAADAAQGLRVLRDRASASRGAVVALHGLIRDVQIIQTKIDTARESLVGVESDIKELTGGVCPVCGGELK